MTQNSTEAEYITASMGAREVVWLRKLLVRLFGDPLNPTIIHCDNQSCIKHSVNPVFHDRSKHIEIPYHYARDMVERNVIQLEYISTSDQTYILTKPLSLELKLNTLDRSLGWLKFNLLLKLSLKLFICTIIFKRCLICKLFYHVCDSMTLWTPCVHY